MKTKYKTKILNLSSPCTGKEFIVKGLVRFEGWNTIAICYDYDIARMISKAWKERNNNGNV